VSLRIIGLSITNQKKILSIKLFKISRASPRAFFVEKILLQKLHANSRTDTDETR
jgi:hypothetical protein